MTLPKKQLDDLNAQIENTSETIQFTSDVIEHHIKVGAE